MQSFTWTGMIEASGPLPVLLLIFFLAVVVVCVERIVFFRRTGGIPEEFFRLIDDKRYSEALSVVRSRQDPGSYVLAEVLSSNLKEGSLNTDYDLFEEVKSRAIAEKQPALEKYFNLLATLGSVSPFLGLFGTVIGIIRAFTELGGGGSDLSGLNAGIAEALVATAAGLLVAIPATAAYNVFQKASQSYIMKIEIACSRLKQSMMRNT